MKSGVIALVGRPNAGKSTLLNALIGENLALVTPKPQTTRKKLIGVYQDEEAQVVFYDTPGAHLPREKLSEFMLKEIEEALEASDGVWFLMDACVRPSEVEGILARRAAILQKPIIGVLNKKDIAPKDHVSLWEDWWKKTFPNRPFFRISASAKEGLKALLCAQKKELPEGPPLFPEDQFSDQPVREWAAEAVRGECLLQLDQEVPYGIAVVVEEFKEDQEPVLIRATLYVEKESHKSIVLGQGGRRLKAIGRNARRKIEGFLNHRVFLELWVKTAENWRKKPYLLERLGYRGAVSRGRKKK